jgi:ABC-2 type transport system permease protein
MIIFISNLKRIFKAKSNLIIMFIFPIIFITLSMMGSVGDSRPAIGIVDKDNTKFTKLLIEKIEDKNDVVLLKETDLKNRLVSANIDYGMVIYNGYTKDILSNKEANITGYSIKESNMSLPTKYYIDSFINSAKNIGVAARGNEQEFYKGLNAYDKGVLAVEYKTLNKDKARGSNTLASMGFLIMSMLLAATMTASIILKDKQNKTFYRIFAGPISSRNYMIQNVLSFFITQVLQLVIIFSIMIFGFNAYFGPSLLAMFGLYMIFSIVCVSIGVAISSIARDSRQAASLSNFVTIPMCMIGGCFWPRDFMPDILVKISNFMPTTWLLKAASKLINGDAISSIFTDVAVLLLFALVFILLGSWKKADITK